MQVGQAKAAMPASAVTIAGAAPTIRSAAPVVKTATGVPAVVSSGVPMTQARVVSGAGTTVAGGSALSAGSVRQAKVLSSSQPMSQPVSYASSTPISSAPRVVSATGQPIVTKAATVVSGEARPNTIAGPAYTQGAYEVKHKDDPQLQNLKELRKTSGLKTVPVDDALQGLKGMSSDGKLTREQFLAAYALLLQNHSVEVPSDAVKNAVFDLFDRDDNGVVDMMEVICGASLLCSGAEDDKIHAVFNVFDENGDGVITMDEMFKFLTSVFKVVLTPNVMAVMNSMGVTVESAEDLASVTALECFKTADLNQDGKLTVSEFKNWFYAPRNDPSFLFSPVRKLLQ